MEPSLRSRVRDGDPDAFGVLFGECARAVHSLAYRLTGNRQEAEEIVSLTFLEAWRLRAGVEPEGESLRPWLMGIAVNVVRNQSRAARRHRAALARLPAPAAVPDFADDLAGRIDDAARLAAVRAAFGRLRPAEQDVVALCVWSELDYAAAAAALGIPVGTVRSRLSRARRKLRRLAGEPDGGGEQLSGDRQPAVRPSVKPAQGGTR
jgi:RNA polymerase sigma factor (sigma-70 family)